MKFNRSGQLLLVSAASLLVAGLVTACSTTQTVDFVYVTSAQAAGTNNYGEIDVLEVNSMSGAMRQIPTSPFPSGGRNPVADAVSADNTNLYVVNQDDNTIVQFVIGNDGKIYPENTVNTPGIFPIAIAISGSNLYVVDTYQPLPTCSNSAPCPGSVAVFPIQAKDSANSEKLGTPVANGNVNYWPLILPAASSDIILPTGIAVLASSSDLYISAYDKTANTGYIFGFWIAPASYTAVPSNVTCPPLPTGATTLPAGTLCPFNGAPVAAGVYPSGIASDPSGSYVYVTDKTGGVVLGFAIQPDSTLAPLTSGIGGGNTFQAGDQPSAIAADPAGGYLYVTNSQDASITSYSMSSGKLTSIGTYATGVQPVAVCVDPSMHHYVYTANFLGSNVSGFEVSSTDGSLINTQNSPYRSNALPTAMVAIPHNGTKP